MIDISRLVSNKKIANKKLEFTFDLQSGVTAAQHLKRWSPTRAGVLFARLLWVPATKQGAVCFKLSDETS